MFTIQDCSPVTQKLIIIQDFLKKDADFVHYCLRDFNLIFRLGMQSKLNADFRFEFYQWLSKLRSEIKIFEKTNSSEQLVRHQFMAKNSPSNLDIEFPYLNFDIDENKINDWEYDDDDFDLYRSPKRATNCSIKVVHLFSSINRNFLIFIRMKPVLIIFPSRIFVDFTINNCKYLLVNNDCYLEKILPAIKFEVAYFS